jgi:hypothetical protein
LIYYFKNSVDFLKNYIVVIDKMGWFSALIGGAIVGGTFALHFKLKGRLTNVSASLKVSQLLDNSVYEKLPILCGLLFASAIWNSFECTTL